MNAKKKNILSLIDKQIAELQSMKEQLLKSIPLIDIVNGKPWLWVIDKNSNTYYQFSGLNHGCYKNVILSRFGKEETRGVQFFNDNFRIASSGEFKQHIEHLERTGKKYIKQNFTQRVEQREALEHKVVNLDFASLYTEAIPKFHDVEYQKLIRQIESEPRKIDPKKCDFYMVTVTGEFGSKVRHDKYENAIKEATRLAKQENHKAWVTGVVAVVEPIQQEIQVKVIEK
jgi:hypothetical protein